MGHVYIADATLNGHKLDKNYITYGDLARGGKLTFTMSDTPVKTRGTTKHAAPFSVSKKCHL